MSSITYLVKCNWVYSEKELWYKLECNAYLNICWSMFETHRIIMTFSNPPSAAYPDFISSELGFRRSCNRDYLYTAPLLSPCFNIICASGDGLGTLPSPFITLPSSALSRLDYHRRRMSSSNQTENIDMPEDWQIATTSSSWLSLTWSCILLSNKFRVISWMSIWTAQPQLAIASSLQQGEFILNWCKALPVNAQHHLHWQAALEVRSTLSSSEICFNAQHHLHCHVVMSAALCCESHNLNKVIKFWSPSLSLFISTSWNQQEIDATLRSSWNTYLWLWELARSLLVLLEG